MAPITEQACWAKERVGMQGGKGASTLWMSSGAEGGSVGTCEHRTLGRMEGLTGILCLRL